MKWFKFYGQDYLSDPKMLALTASERSCWITLLCYSSINDNGKITFLSEEQLMIQAGLDFTCEEWNNTKGVLEKFKKLKMIQDDNGELLVLNWQKRQETNLTSYERVKRHREKKRKDNIKITPEENRIEENRIDKSKKEESISSPKGELPTPEEQAREFFKGGGEFYERVVVWALKIWPKSEIEIKRFIAYWTEPNKSGKKQRWELQKTFELKRRITTWMSKSKNNTSNKYKIGIV